MDFNLESHPKMNNIPYAFQSTSNRSSSAHYFIALCKIMRLAFVCAFMILAVLVFVVYSFNHTLLSKAQVVAKNIVIQSPLQDLLLKEQAAHEELREVDCEMLKTINERSTLELKTLVLAETIVPFEDREQLVNYVSKQLEASDVVTNVQACVVMTMVNLASIEASVSKEEIGQSGTLRNSAVLALIKRHLNNVHFMMIAVRAEPRLSWRWIGALERNSWNNVLSRVLINKVRVEAQNYLWQRNVGEMPEVIHADAKNHLALQQLIPESFSA